MKAIVFTKFGPPDVLQLKEVAKPTPKDNELLVKVHAASVNFGDILARHFSSVSPRQFSMPLLMWIPTRLFFGLRKPKINILGAEFSGEIEAVGKMVTRFKIGDRVYGYRGMNFGANAEYLAVPEHGMVAIKPTNMTSEEAAAVPYGAITALSLLRKANVQRGQKVLINGASGAIGSYAVQLARYFGAEVTGVCSTERLELVKSLGAERVIDYTREDFTESGETYDLIFDVLGKGSFSRSKKVLAPNGRYFHISFKMKQVFQMLWTSLFGRQKLICALSDEKPEDLVFIKELIEAGHIKSIVDRCFPLEQAAEAHRYVEQGHKRGHVVLTVARGEMPEAAKHLSLEGAAD